jgi:hypothetical protein
MVLAVDGETLLKTLMVSDTTIVAFFLQRFAVSLNGALRSGHRQREHQHEENYARDKVREWFSHCKTLLNHAMAS